MLDLIAIAACIAFVALWIIANLEYDDKFRNAPQSKKHEAALFDDMFDDTFNTDKK